MEDQAKQDKNSHQKNEDGKKRIEWTILDNQDNQKKSIQTINKMKSLKMMSIEKLISERRVKLIREYWTPNECPLWEIIGYDLRIDNINIFCNFELPIEYIYILLENNHDHLKNYKILLFKCS